MHWFWRAAIAVGAGVAAVFVIMVLIDAYFGSPRSNVLQSMVVGGVLVLTHAAAVFMYSIMTQKYGPNSWEHETRCRKCDYILRGITEPRCPECGERI